MRTLKETRWNKTTLRLVEKSGAFVGLAIEGGKIQATVEGDSADDVWLRLHDAAMTLSPNYFGFDGAKSRFLKIFQQGFETPSYATHERDYKLEAKCRLDETVPLEAALDGTGHGESILAVFRGTNLLSQFEMIRMQAALRSDQADSFIQGAAKFAFGDINAGLAQMAQALKPHEVAKWTAITYLPYLWLPDSHMFLKPAVTCEFSERVGHAFANNYLPDLDVGVYQSLLDLADTTASKIADLKPRDRIDIQSFIWVVGAYDVAAEEGVVD